MKKVLNIILNILLTIFCIIIILVISMLAGLYLYKYLKNTENEVAETTTDVVAEVIEEKNTIENNELEEEKEINKKKSITISAVGDCTIGWDTRYIAQQRFDAYLEKNNGNYGYYLEKVKDVFSEDDITIVNLEGTFTEYKKKVPKEFNFSAPPEYKNVLTLGNVDVVSFANNHSYDFGEIGYNDTLEALDSINMPYYSYEKYLIKEINGIKLGFFALSDISCKNYKDIDQALEYIKKEETDLIIASMHWGTEGSYKQNAAQIKMAHYMIDKGVDLILGSHPHRLQGIEKYKERYIVYSMANFCFGGNTNPEDKDSMIYRQTFTIEDGKLKIDDNINIIPASVSGVKYTNNYQPIVLEGKEGKRVLNKILRYSKGFEYEINI